MRSECFASTENSLVPWLWRVEISGFAQPFCISSPKPPYVRYLLLAAELKICFACVNLHPKYRTRRFDWKPVTAAPPTWQQAGGWLLSIVLWRKLHLSGRRGSTVLVNSRSLARQSLWMHRLVMYGAKAGVGRLVQTPVICRHALI